MVTESQYDPTDDRRIFRFDFHVMDDADFRSLAAEELTYEGPFVDSHGRAMISMYATGYLASRLAGYGFEVEPANVVRGYRVGDRIAGSVVAHHHADHCSPPVVPDPSTSDYFWDWADIANDLTAIGASHAAITTHAFGTSLEGRNIVGVQFGPLEPIQDPPVVYVLCHLTFSLLFDGLGSSRLVVERDTGSGAWEEVYAMPYRSPINNGFLPNDQLLSLAFEANNMLSVGKIPAFRLRMEGGPPTLLQVFDPIAWCRQGPLP